MFVAGSYREPYAVILCFANWIFKFIIPQYAVGDITNFLKSHMHLTIHRWEKNSCIVYTILRLRRIDDQDPIGWQSMFSLHCWNTIFHLNSIWDAVLVVCVHSTRLLPWERVNVDLPALLKMIANEFMWHSIQAIVANDLLQSGYVMVGHESW